ncbi:terminase small subunit [Aureimonas sp. SK2]|uniref:terminase small subunit n=1 Tax=Aureimonas sp. SK2 TaxID=3015992 RepID=UPI002443F781|nr:terminase small subunit [Aureimonas sp. SK2]
MPKTAKQPEGVLNPTDVGTHAAPSRRDAARGRQMSLSQIAGALDRDRNTVKKWLDQGCPFVEKADRDTGREWALDVAEVVRWLERRSAEAAAEKLGAGPDGAVTEGEAKRRRAVAQAIIAEAEAAEIMGTLSRTSVMLDRVAADYAEIRGRLTGIGDTAAGQVERKVAKRVKEIVDEAVSGALSALRTDGGAAPSAG